MTFKLKTNIHVAALLVMLFAFLLYLITWHKQFVGYEMEVLKTAQKLLEGEFNAKQIGISGALLYTPFILLFKLSGSSDIYWLSIVPVIYSALTVYLTFYCAWFLTNKIRTSVIVTMIIATCSIIWPYANVGMEYQLTFYATLLLFTLFVWQRGHSLLFAGIALALLSTAKIYGIVFIVPYAVFLYFSNRKPKNLLYAFLPAIIFITISLLLKYKTYGQLTGLYTLSYETTSSIWWTGFYGIFFSVNKSIFLYCPMLIITLFYWKKFFLHHKETALFILLSFAGIFLLRAPFDYWADEFWGIRYFVPIMGLLHLPLIHAFEKKLSPVKISAFVILGLTAIYVQILGTTYSYSKQMEILSSADLDTLYNIQYEPRLSSIRIHHALLTSFITKKDKELAYKEYSWKTRLSGKPDELYKDISIDLKDFNTPDIVWIRRAQPSHP